MQHTNVILWLAADTNFIKHFIRPFGKRSQLSRASCRHATVPANQRHEQKHLRFGLYPRSAAARCSLSQSETRTRPTAIWRELFPRLAAALTFWVSLLHLGERFAFRILLFCQPEISSTFSELPLLLSLSFLRRHEQCSAEVWPCNGNSTKRSVKNIKFFGNQLTLIKLFYLCVESPPRPVSQEQILPHVALDDSNSNSNEKNDQFYNFVPRLKKLVSVTLFSSPHLEVKTLQRNLQLFKSCQGLNTSDHTSCGTLYA